MARSFPAPTPVFAGSPNKGAYQAQQATRVAHQNMIKSGGRRRYRKSRRRRKRGGNGTVAVPQFNNASSNDLVVQAASHQLNADNVSSSLSNTGNPKTGGTKRKKSFFFLRT